MYRYKYSEFSLQKKYKAGVLCRRGEDRKFYLAEKKKKIYQCIKYILFRLISQKKKNPLFIRKLYKNMRRQVVDDIK